MDPGWVSGCLLLSQCLRHPLPYNYCLIRESLGNSGLPREAFALFPCTSSSVFTLYLGYLRDQPFPFPCPVGTRIRVLPRNLQHEPPCDPSCRSQGKSPREPRKPIAIPSAAAGLLQDVEAPCPRNERLPSCFGSIFGPGQKRVSPAKLLRAPSPPKTHPKGSKLRIRGNRPHLHISPSLRSTG